MSLQPSIGWLIDADMFPHYREELISAISDQGHRVETTQAPNPPYRWDDAGSPYQALFPKGTCVVTHADIELTTRVHEEGLWTPGAFCTVENYFCSSYYCKFGEFLLNREYTMLPFGELSRCKDYLFASFGNEGRLFIRPDSPLKLFTGQIATYATFAADLEYMGFYEFPDSSLAVVSSPQQIINEWRFVVADGKIAAGCQYSSGSQQDLQPTYEPSAKALAQKIAEIGYEPDPAWVIDICKTADEKYHLLEIGGFSFADLYACNKKDVVSAVSAAASRAWKKAQVDT